MLAAFCSHLKVRGSLCTSEMPEFLKYHAGFITGCNILYMQECRFALHVMIRPRAAERLCPTGLDRKWLRRSGGVNFLLMINSTDHAASCFPCSICLRSTRFIFKLVR